MSKELDRLRQKRDTAERQLRKAQIYEDKSAVQDKVL